MKQENRPGPPDEVHDPKLLKFQVNDGEQTQTIDLGSLFANETTSSGSFGEFLQALSVPTLLIDKSYRIEFANEALTAIFEDASRVVGRPLAAVFSDPEHARAIGRMVERVLRHRKPGVTEKTLGIHRRRIRARIHVRTITPAQDRPVLLQLENLAAPLAEDPGDE